MSETVRGVVVAHGTLAGALVQEAERIGGQSGRLVPVSNAGVGPEEIERRVSEAMGTGAAVIFVDMPCGSCFFAAMRVARERPGVRVVTGVNLSMLLDFVHNPPAVPEEAATRAAAKGAEAIRHP